MLLVDHALDGEDHVVGSHVAAGLEVLGGVELHALAQLEGVGQPVGGNGPGLCQAGLDIGAALLELRQSVEHRVACGVEGGARRVLRGVKALGAAFGTVDQRARRLGGRSRRRHAQSHHQFLQFKHRSSSGCAGEAESSPVG
jgi:hypothetical protein